MNNPYFATFVTAILTGVATAVIVFVIKRLFRQRDAKDAQIAALVRLQDDAVKKDAEMARKHTAEALRIITETLTHKVPWDHCTERRRIRDLEATAFSSALKTAEIADTKNDYLHTTITTTLERLQETIDRNEKNSSAVRDVLFDKLNTIDITLKLINGSVRDTKEALAVHIVKGHG